MKHVIYEDPIGHRFALIRLPGMFIEGDPLPIPPATQWLATREEALAALAGLFDVDEDADQR